MKLASYKGTRDGWRGWFNRLVRLRLRGPYSHCEIVFEWADFDAARFMPDQTTTPTADGALWCFSADGFERIPAWSKFRAGKIGGYRFKRIVLDPEKWDFVTLPDAGAAMRAGVTAMAFEGRRYDFGLIARFLFWPAPATKTRGLCSTACAQLLGLESAHRFDPCNLHYAVKGLT